MLLKLKKQCKINEGLSKENDELKDQLVKLEVMLTRRDVELGTFSSKIDHAEEIFHKLNTGTSKLNDILSISHMGTTDLGFDNPCNTTINVVSTNGKPFIRYSMFLQDQSKTVRPGRSYKCHYC